MLWWLPWHFKCCRDWFPIDCVLCAHFLHVIKGPLTLQPVNQFDTIETAHSQHELVLMVSSLTHNDTVSPPTPVIPRRTVTVEWVLAILFFLGNSVATWLSGGFYALLTVLLPLIGLGLIFLHGIRRYGWLRMVAFFVITQIVSNGFENMSILTGFPFGLYHYTGGPKIFLVPWFIGLAYFTIGYGAWTLSATLLGRADAHLDLRTRQGKVNLVLLPVFAGALMTLWDLGMDSTSSTISHTWIWTHGGALFGVAAKNYFGWLFVTYVFFQIFTIILAVAQTRGTRDGFEVARPNGSAPAIVLYLTAGCGAVLKFWTMHGTHDVVTDKAGVLWHVADIYESMMLISVFTVILLSVIGMGKILRGDESHTHETTSRTAAS